MEQVTQLHRLSDLETEVVNLLRLLNPAEQEFIRCLLKAREEASRRQGNVVRFRLG